MVDLENLGSFGLIFTVSRESSCKVEHWGCPELADSGLGIKTKESPHEDAVKQTGSQ